MQLLLLAKLSEIVMCEVVGCNVSVRLDAENSCNSFLLEQVEILLSSNVGAQEDIFSDLRIVEFFEIASFVEFGFSARRVRNFETSGMSVKIFAELIFAAWMPLNDHLSFGLDVIIVQVRFPPEHFHCSCV